VSGVNLDRLIPQLYLFREWDAMRELIEGDMQLLEKTFR
jgi:hypothetical protein